MKKILRPALVGCAILLTLYSCGRIKWDWKADPYMADHNTQSLYSANDVVVTCEDPRFSNYTCFTSDNMAELIFNIKRLKKAISKSKMSKSNKRKYKSYIDKVLNDLPVRDL